MLIHNVGDFGMLIVSIQAVPSLKWHLLLRCSTDHSVSTVSYHGSLIKHCTELVQIPYFYFFPVSTVTISLFSSRFCLLVKCSIFACQWAHYSLLVFGPWQFFIGIDAWGSEDETCSGSGYFPCVQNLRFEFHTDLSHPALVQYFGQQPAAFDKNASIISSSAPIAPSIWTSRCVVK